MAMQESSFLTSLKMDAKALNKQQRREDLLDGTKSGGQILKLHSDLQSLADELDEKVEAKLNANENAFFLAYKSHMYTVQKEFRELKQKADEEETKSRRDKKVTSLEKELEWFMSEALRLDEQCKKYKKELDKWKGQAEALEDDRQFLENQIKNAKRHNKSLRGSVQKAQTSAYTALVAADEAKQEEEEPATTGAIEVAKPPTPPDHMESPLGPGLTPELEQRYQNCVRRLKQQLDTEQRLAQKMRTIADRQFTEPSELESFFGECIDKVKADISERRRQKEDYHRKLHPVPKKEKGKQQMFENTYLPVKIDDFSPGDRRKVIELLLSSEQVLRFLYDKLFP
eukprot:CAMPEP_0178427796 /NCGR_PEP_ID=MMETSP0689_2-20121128/29930_1 /TAXON_ID=160604 /ORGANISM="Amphidinium massartii, Strain CS-259" /LENGTH=341 /DNA_ID=CAMNT_0020049515 /DNA_START=92 /DNA_END=1113 /DNA_ORIENTATION=-